jgi:hypothetical protein
MPSCTTTDGSWIYVRESARYRDRESTITPGLWLCDSSRHISIYVALDHATLALVEGPAQRKAVRPNSTAKKIRRETDHAPSVAATGADCSLLPPNTSSGLSRSDQNNPKKN